MRVLGNIEHPELKITVFKMENRITVKFENRGYELSFKLGTDDNLTDLDRIKKWIDPDLIAGIQTSFGQLHRLKLAANARAFPEQETSEFEDIL